MRGVNEVTLIGNVGSDPDSKYTAGGDCVTKFSLATNERWKDKQGNDKEHTEWHNIVCWGKSAEVLAEHVKKGDPLYIKGQIQTQSWEKDGITRYMTSIKVRDWQFLSSGQTQGNRQPQRQKPQQAAQAPADDFGDDIPF